MRTFIQKGNSIDYSNSGAAIAYHDVVPLGSRIGVAQSAIASGAVGAMEVTGIWEMDAETGVAWAIGDALYWDNTGKKLTKTASANTAAGWCTEVKASAAALGKVKIG